MKRLTTSNVEKVKETKFVFTVMEYTLAQWCCKGHKTKQKTYPFLITIIYFVSQQFYL